MSGTANIANSPSTEESQDYPHLPSVDKGKGKAKAIEPESEEDEEDDIGDEDEEDEDEDELAELIQDEEELAEIDTSNIVWTGRRRNAPLDYSSEEALKQAGLDSGSGAAEPEEEDAEFQGEQMDDE